MDTSTPARRLARPVTLLATFLLGTVLAACGGSAATTAPASPGGASQGQAGGGTPPAGGATQAPGGLPTQAPAAPNTAEGACALLTPDEIEEATGFRPIRTTPTTAPGDLPVGCEWELDNVTRGTGDFPWAIVIGVRSPGGRAVYDAFVASPVQAGEPVAGVGDDAQQNEDAVVDAVKGDTMITVTWMEFPPRAEVTVELARLALEGI